MNNAVAGIVVLYYPDEEVKTNIESYQKFFDYLLLIDNSGNSNEEMFQGILCNSRKYIPLYENKGIAYAINTGVDYIRQFAKDVAYVITMDQDSKFGSDIIYTYQNYISQYGLDDIMALTPQYSTDRVNLRKTDSYETVKLTMQSGTLFPLKVLDQLGPFDNELFLDVVDWEYFVRGRCAGLKIIRCNEAVLIHQPATTVSKKILGRTLCYGTAAPIRYYYQIRNLLWAAKKYRYPYFLFVFCVKWAKIFLLFENKKEYIRCGKRAIKDATHSILGPYR